MFHGCKHHLPKNTLPPCVQILPFPAFFSAQLYGNAGLKQGFISTAWWAWISYPPLHTIIQKQIELVQISLLGSCHLQFPLETGSNKPKTLKHHHLFLTSHLSCKTNSFPVMRQDWQVLLFNVKIKVLGLFPNSPTTHDFSKLVQNYLVNKYLSNHFMENSQVSTF